VGQIFNLIKLNMTDSEEYVDNLTNLIEDGDEDQPL
jgi:hypothetical protein